MAKKQLKGVVKSTKAHKTIVVIVERSKKHPKYRKYITRSKKYKAHYEEGSFKEGEKVIIEESRPLSKDKHWKVVSKAADKTTDQSLVEPVEQKT